MYNKIIKQHDEKDCGAACLSMISHFFGLSMPLQKFINLTDTDKNGTNLLGIIEASNKIGLKADALHGDIEDLRSNLRNKTISLPAIAHVITAEGFQHFIVIFEIKKDIIIIGDPAKGKIKTNVSDFSNIWSGYILNFSITSKFIKANYNSGIFKNYLNILKNQYKIFMSIFILSLFIASIGISGAFVFEIIIDKIQNETELHNSSETLVSHNHSDDNTKSINTLERVQNVIKSSSINTIFIIILGLYIFQFFMQFIRGYLISVLTKKIDITLTLPYLKKIFSISITDINIRQTGEYLSRFSDISVIRNAISEVTISLVLDLIMVCTCGFILYRENYILFYISLAIVVLYFLLALLYNKPIKKINQQVMEQNASIQSYLKESIDGIETIKATNSEKNVIEKTVFKLENLINSIFKGNIIYISQENIANTVEIIGTLFIIWAGFNLIINNSITLGSMLTFYALLAYFIAPIKNLIELQPTIQAANVSIQRLWDIMLIEDESGTLEQTSNLEYEKITFQNVNFKYSKRDYILHDINIQINRGQKIAIVGESGSGKTTLFKLLLKFFEIESGEILIDDVNISKINCKHLRNNIAYVDQNTFFFTDTILNNLTLGNENIEIDKVIDTCKKCKIHDFINSLPLGYSALLTENGQNLSEGQKQRLSIARALLRNPKIIIFDEATSNLDPNIELEIKQLIFSLRNITCIIIAHKMNLITDCDQIYLLQNGRIVERGTHDTLFNKHGRYYETYNRSHVLNS